MCLIEVKKLIIIRIKPKTGNENQKTRNITR